MDKHKLGKLLLDTTTKALKNLLLYTQHHYVVSESPATEN